LVLETTVKVVESIPVVVDWRELSPFLERKIGFAKASTRRQNVEMKRAKSALIIVMVRFEDRCVYQRYFDNARFLK